MNTTTIILAAGHYPTRPEHLALLYGSERVICCDSAAETFIRQSGHAPWRIVGDLDSLPEAFRKAYATIIVHEAEQETNDLTKAVRYAQSQGAEQLLILGATGRREDHTLGNISLLIDYMRQGLAVEMLTDYGRFLPRSGTFRTPLPVGSQLSIFSFGAVHFKSQGLRYPLHDFRNWWEGTLNETTAPQVCIQAQGDFLIYLPYEN